MTEKIPEIDPGGAVLDRSRHICAFFHSKDEEYHVLLPFIKEGIARRRGPGLAFVHIPDSQLSDRARWLLDCKT